MAQERDHKPGNADRSVQSQLLRSARASVDDIDMKVRALLNERQAVLTDMRQRLAACKHLGIPVDAECERLVNDPGLDDVVGLLAPPRPSFHKEALRYLRARAGEGATAAEIQQHVERSIGRAFGRTTAPTTLHRLVVSGEVRQEGRRYFPVLRDAQSTEVPTNGLEIQADVQRRHESPKLRHRPASPAEVKPVVRRILLERNMPLRASDILAELEKELRVSGVNPLNSLQTTLGHARSEFTNLKGLGYWLVDLPYAPAGYVPSSHSDNTAESASRMGKTSQQAPQRAE